MTRQIKATTWVRLSTDYFDHPKIQGLSSDAVRLHLMMITYSGRFLLDGVLPAEVVERMNMEVEYRSPNRSSNSRPNRSPIRSEDRSPIEELLGNAVTPDGDPSVIVNSDGDYVLVGYSDMQQSRAEVEAKINAGKASIQKRWGSKDSSATRSPNRSPNSKSDRSPNRTPNTDTDTDTDTDIYSLGGAQKSETPSGQTPATTPQTKKRAHRIPDDWGPTDTHREFAEAHRLDLEAEAEKFRDHAEAHDRRLVQWNSGFSGWLRKAVEFRDARHPGSARPGQQYTTAHERKLIAAQQRVEQLQTEGPGRPWYENLSTSPPSFEGEIIQLPIAEGEGR